MTFDPVAVIEHAYDLVATDRDWLLGLVEMLRPALDSGLGVSGAMWATHSGDLRSVHEVSTRPELVALAPVVYRQLGAAAPQYYTHVPSFDQAAAYASDPTVASVLSECSSALGTNLADIIGVSVGDGQTSGIAITSFASTAQSVGRARRRLLTRLALHAGAGLRLRARARTGLWPGVMAVLDPSGRALHAERDAQSAEARARLRDAVLAMDRARGTMRRRSPEDAVELWRALVAGRWTVVDWIDSDGRRLLVVCANAIDAGDPRRLTAREREVAEFLVHGRSNGEVAYALGLSAATVNKVAQSALRKLGRARRADLAGLFGSPDLRAGQLDGDPPVLVVEGGGHSPALWGRLRTAERAVVERALQGMSNREIARDRGRSERTIANQLAGVYARFGVRGRTELVALLGAAPPR